MDDLKPGTDPRNNPVFDTLVFHVIQNLSHKILKEKLDFTLSQFGSRLT